MRENFGEFIKRLRTENNLTLTQLGGKIGIDAGALSKIENGKKRLDEKALPKLAKLFKLDLSELKDEFFSEMFALEICKQKCSEKALDLAAQKIGFIKERNTKQGSITFQP